MNHNILISSVFILIYAPLFVQTLNELCPKKAFEDIDCKKQLWGPDIENAFCQIKYWKLNSTECRDMQFSEDTSHLESVGGVSIRPFAWYFSNISFYTILDTIFTDIKWNYIKFRFQNTGNDNLRRLKNYCREIIIGAEELVVNSSSLRLNFGCVWSQQHALYEGENYNMEYEAMGANGFSKGKYIFQVPAMKDLPPFKPDDWSPFVYLNVLDPQNVHVRIVPLDESIQIDGYYVNICLQVPKTHRKKEICEDSLLQHVPGKELIYTHRMASSGLYTFEVTPISKNCTNGKCRPVQPPRVNIVLEQETVVYTILWVALAFSIFWIPIVLWMSFKWRVKKRSHPNVLIIHPPGNKMDAEVVDLLVKYFKYELYWNLLLKDDIKLTNHNNPYIWCMDAFNKADIILYIVNPYSKDQNEAEYAENNIYTNLDQILLKYIRNGQAKCPIANILFDHYKARQIPKELTHIKTFRLLKDWYKLLYFVMGYNFWDRLNRNIPKLQSSERGREICTLLHK